MKTSEKIYNATRIAYLSTRKNTSLEKRCELLLNSLLSEGINADNIILCQDDKPARGAAFSVIEMADRYRVNYRCGYSRHNYAPCIEILK
jgi:hypothetical protein